MSKITDVIKNKIIVDYDHLGKCFIFKNKGRNLNDCYVISNEIFGGASVYEAVLSNDRDDGDVIGRFNTEKEAQIACYLDLSKYYNIEFSALSPEELKKKYVSKAEDRDGMFRLIKNMTAAILSV